MTNVTINNPRQKDSLTSEEIYKSLVPGDVFVARINYHPEKVYVKTYSGELQALGDKTSWLQGREGKFQYLEFNTFYLIPDLTVTVSGE